MVGIGRNNAIAQVSAVGFTCHEMLGATQLVHAVHANSYWNTERDRLSCFR